MANGFLVRVAAVCDRLARQAAQVADGARQAGLMATASTAQTVADTLARLAYDAAHDPKTPLARVSEQTGDCAKAMRQIARDLELLDDLHGPALCKAAKSASVELATVARDSLSQTQPIE